jgi:hypothetical protein
MRAPSAASVLLFLASISVLLAAHSRGTPPNHMVIDRAFLTELHSEQQKVARGQPDHRFAELIYGHTEELHYLVRHDDPLATVIVMRLMTRGRVSSNDCTCCDPDFAPDLCFRDACRAFWDELAAMSADDQWSIIVRVDAHACGEAAETFRWHEDLRTFLSARPPLQQRWAMQDADDTTDR